MGDGGADDCKEVDLGEIPRNGHTCSSSDQLLY